MSGYEAAIRVDDYYDDDEYDNLQILLVLKGASL